MRWSAAVSLGLAAAVLVSCGDGGARPSTPPRDLFEGMRAAAPLDLRSQDLLEDARGAGSLGAVLDEGAFAAGVERGYAGGSAEIRHVDVAFLRFATEPGAGRYLRWLGSHVEDLIGEADPVAALKVPPAATVYLHEPTGCCAKETNVALVAWVDGSDVVRLVVRGPGASKDIATALALTVHAWRERT